MHEYLPDYEDAPNAISHAKERGGAEGHEEENEGEGELEDDNEVASDTEHIDAFPTSRPHLHRLSG